MCDEKVNDGSSVCSRDGQRIGARPVRDAKKSLPNALASAAIQACTSKNYQVSVTVVDRAGVVKAVQRTDNAGPHTLKASEMKAFTALSTKNASGKVMESAQSNAGAQNLRDIPGLLLLAGGLPVKEGDEVIGAIGIGGAPGGHLDEACAQQAIDSMTTS
jgi:uncharacterized protein GlcG (DUF336 family)